MSLKIGMLLGLGILLNGFSLQDDFPLLKGPYLGQEPPGLTAEIFAPGIISTLEMPEMCSAFTADGKEFYYNAQHKSRWSIFLIRETNGRWTKPRPLAFTSGYTDRDFTMSSIKLRTLVDKNMVGKFDDNNTATCKSNESFYNPPFS
jgi:hypothetical protein